MEISQIIQITIFAILFAVAHFIAIKTVLKYWRLSHLGQPLEIKTSMGHRLKNVFINVLLQKKLMKKPVRGIFHIFIFYGFLIYGLHTTSQLIGGFINDYDFYIPLLISDMLDAPIILHFYDYLLDVFTILVLVGLTYFASRRWITKAPELDRPSSQSAIVISMISILMLFTLLGEPARVIKDGISLEGLSPIRISLVSLMENSGVTVSLAETLFIIAWWGHIGIVFLFMMYVPSSKHAHLIWAPVNFFFEQGTPKGAINYMDVENATVWGATNVQDFTWKDHLNGLSCIECGRCSLECPANRTGKLLNPKSIMTDLKHALMEQMDKVEAAKKAGKSDEEIAADTSLRVIDNYTKQESLWACTTCYACVEACPVGNNQVDAIVGMRRALVLNEGSMPTELQNALTNIENQSNPWGVGSHKREEWAEGLDVKTMAQWSQSGEKPDVLFWVGCAGAFDDRNKKIAKSFVNILNRADVKFGILGQEENCTGDSARRAGNEYLYQTLAGQNIETMNHYGVKKIVAQCPHCFNTLKNEYPQLGGNYEVIHHTTFIQELVKNKQVTLDKTKTEEFGSIAYHDSCYLGRYNDEYSSPRSVLQSASSKDLLEAEDNKKTGLCCGAGGAQMWKEEENGKERVNVKRTNQLLDTGAKTVASACPFCITMIGDGVKSQEKEESVRTLDISEIVEKALS